MTEAVTRADTGLRLEGVLLFVDYPGRRPEGRLTDLHLETEGYAVQPLLHELLPREPDAGDYVRALLPAVDLSRPVDAVLAYCAAGGIGHETAAQLARRQAKPPSLVLFDAEPCSPAAVMEAYRVALTQMVWGVSVPAAPLPDLVQTLTDQPRLFLDRVGKHLLELAVAVLSHDGEEFDGIDVIAAQIADHHLRWIAHLLASCTASLTPWGGEVLHILSDDHTFAGDWPGARRSSTQRMDAGHSELLRDPQTRQVVDTWLRGQLAKAS